jgi:starch synthase
MPFMGYGVQGALRSFGLPPAADKRLPEWSRGLPLPLGLLSADRIVAVSPTYAREIFTPEFGCGLQDFLRQRASSISGILNGLDTQVWNPADDPWIHKPYDASRLALRAENKRALQAEFHLPQLPDIPLVILVSRMDPQKGVDLAVEGLWHNLDLPWQAILLGTGDPELERSIRRLEASFPNRARAAIRFDSRLSHRMYSSGDILLMPSRYEPCGLSQMIAMRYGCVPVASAVGGLADTIIDHRPDRPGTGFLFMPVTAEAFSQALDRAIQAYLNPNRWAVIQQTGMAADYSWSGPAQEYASLYISISKGDL